MDVAYARRYRELYERHWWWRAREHVILDTLRRIEPPGGFPSILDIGCGDGLFFDRLAGFGVVEGVESDASLVDPDGKHRARIHVGPFDARFQPGRRYSLILMLDVIEHLDDPVGALRHARTLLEPGGVFLATVPAFRLLWTAHDDFNHHHTRYTKRTFRELARQGGIEVVVEKYLFQWTFPAKLAVRLAEASFRRTPVPARVPPAGLNRALYLLSRAEQRLLGPLPVPFGTSLLVVGRAHQGAHPRELDVRDLTSAPGAERRGQAI
jgi:SAM-dependent methyltransferase